MEDSTQYSPATVLLALVKFAGVGPRLIEVLLQHYRRLDRIPKADSKSLMAINGMTTKAVRAITNSAGFLEEADQYLATLKDRGIQVVTKFDDDYPRRFFELNDPPPLLYVRGRMPEQAKKTLTIAGTESASNEGIELTAKLARTCAQAGVQVVSSLRMGIDAAAHLGAKAANGGSFAVLETGLDSIDPSHKMPLAIDIAQMGGVLSEYSPEQTEQTKAYHTSNRLLAGLAQGVVITEVYEDSMQTLDLLDCCSQIGKLSFILIDPKHGALTDEKSLNKAVTCGAIPMVGLDKIDDIINSLV